MATSADNSANGDRERHAQIAALVDDTLKQLDNGESVDFDELERAHPELMPELGETLRNLASLRAARDKAQVPLAPAEEQDAWLEEDLEFLRRAFDRYEVLGRVQHGGQGVVYKARQRGANRIVAIKVLLDGPLATDRQRRRFEREIELISRLNHPNIVTLFDNGTIRGRHYFTMEYVEGLPIDDYAVLHDLTPRQIVRMFLKVCHAVSYAHQNGIIHRDLSPANILVDEAGEPHVFDFGLAKDVWSSVQGGGSLTGQIIGTLPYMSPEQAGGLDGKIDVRSDIYTLAVVLFQLLTDTYPYDVSGDAHEARHAILNTPPRPLRKAARMGGDDWLRELDTINRDLEEILSKALAKEKDERYQSIATFAEDLERCLAGEAISARADNRFYLLRKSIRRYRVAVAVVALIMLTAGVSWLQVRAQRDNARRAAEAAFELFEDTYDIEQILTRLPGGVAIRDDLIQGLSERLPELETLVGADEALEPIGAMLLEKQGDIAAQQGKLEEAARKYEQFLQSSQRLAQQDPSEIDYQDRISRAYRKLAEVGEQPHPLYEQGLRHAKAVWDCNPSRDEARYNLAQMHLSFANHLFTAQNYHEALDQFDSAIALFPTEDPRESERWAQAAAIAKDHRGRILIELGKGSEGLAELATSLQIRQHIIEANPTDTEARDNLRRAYACSGTAQRNAGNTTEAKRMFREAVRVGEMLRAMDPTASAWGFGLYSMYDRLARLHNTLGEYAEAQEVADQAVALANELVTQTDDVERAQSTLAYAHILRGFILLDMGALADAAIQLEAAARIRTTLLEQDPGNSALQRSLATTHATLGICYREAGRLEEALPHYQAAFDMRRKLLEAQPDNVDRAIAFARSHIGLAAAYMEARTTAGNAMAESYLSQAKSLVETLRANDQTLALSRKHDKIMEAITTNQTILQRRSQNGPATTGAASDELSPE